MTLGTGPRFTAAIAALFVAAALTGCKTTADSSTTIGLHDGGGAARPTQAALAEPPSGAVRIQSDDGADPSASAASEPQSYYLDFRARPSPASGHVYVVYGPLDGSGRALEKNIVGFGPKGGIFGIAAGTAPLPIPGVIGEQWGDERLPVLTAYRATVGRAQYENMLAFLARERKKEKYWNLWVYNCNSFAGELAEAAGLQAPAFTAVSPVIYVAAMKAMNGHGARPDPSLTTAGHVPPLRNDKPILIE